VGILFIGLEGPITQYSRWCGKKSEKCSCMWKRHPTFSKSHIAYFFDFSSVNKL